MKLDTEFPKVDQEVKISCESNVGRAAEQPLYKLRLQAKWKVNNSSICILNTVYT